MTALSVITLAILGVSMIRVWWCIGKMRQSLGEGEPDAWIEWAPKGFRAIGLFQWAVALDLILLSSWTNAVSLILVGALMIVWSFVDPRWKVSRTEPDPSD